MKRVYMSFVFMLLALAFTAQDASAQDSDTLDVAPGIGTLNDAINGDTTDTGERLNPNRVYRLQRGLQAYYGLEGSIENRFPLTIVAEEGDGPRPFLQPRVVGDGSSRAFRARDHITLKGLHVTNKDDLDGINTRMLRASAEDIRIIVDDCWFEEDGQSFIRCDDPGMKIYVTNTVIGNVGQPTSPNNGRGIDDRGNDIDTVWFENCTFYNITSRIIRDGGGSINYARFNNNTVYNVGQMGITFGPTAELEVWSNLFVNVGLMPVGMDSDRVIFTVDSIQVDSVTTQAPEILWNRNLIYFDTTQVAGYMGDTLMLPPILSEDLGAWYAENYGTTPPVGEMVEFTDAPPFPDSLILYDIVPDLDQGNAPGWEMPDIPGDPEGNGLYHAVVPFDFGYTNQVAYSLGFGDTWGGDNNWEAMGEDFMMVDFERPWERKVWWTFGIGENFEYMDLEVIPNPDKSGANTSDHVLKFTVNPDAQNWAGAYSDAYGTMAFTQEMHSMEMMVWKDKISDIGLKVEQGDGPVTELKAPNTVTSEWEAVRVDFDANIGTNSTRLVIFPDFGARDAEFTAYLDNIKIVETPVSVEEEDVSVLRVYPNPVIDLMQVSQQGMNTVVVRDVLGKTVMSLNPQGKDQIMVNASGLADGIYFITVDSEAGTSTTKFLKR